VDDVRTITETRTGDNTFERTLSRSRDRIFTGSLSVNAFELTMNAFEQTDGVSIYSTPKIIGANEKEALVDMTTKEPNLTVTTSRTGTSGDQLDLSARLELIPGEKGDKDGKGKGLFAGEAFFSYGISLKVTPRISSSGLITVNIEPSISNLERYYSFDIPANASTVTPKYPVIYMQRLQTVFSMQSGSTAVIGGLSKTTENSVDSGIPGLRSLPWIGPRVFGWKSREKEQKEIVIFVTVGIADPVDLPQDVGMPKNAVLGRGILSGENKEPGDRPRSELLRLDEPKRPVSPVDQPAAESSLPAAPASQAPAAPPPDAPANEREAAQEAAAPAAIEPLLRNE
jgi:type II secretory pathway component GspD/PulD (secretin)